MFWSGSKLQAPNFNEFSWEQILLDVSLSKQSCIVIVF